MNMVSSRGKKRSPQEMAQALKDMLAQKQQSQSDTQQNSQQFSVDDRKRQCVDASKATKDVLQMPKESSDRTSPGETRVEFSITPDRDVVPDKNKNTATDIQARIATQDQEIKVLKEKLKAHTKDLTAMYHRKEQYKEKLALAEKSNENLQNDAKAKIAKIDSELMRTDQAFRDCKNRADQLVQQLHERGSNLQKLKKERDDAINLSVEFQERCGELEKHNTDLEKQAYNLKLEIDMLKDANDAMGPPKGQPMAYEIPLAHISPCGSVNVDRAKFKSVTPQREEVLEAADGIFLSPEPSPARNAPMAQQDDQPQSNEQDLGDAGTDQQERQQQKLPKVLEGIPVVPQQPRVVIRDESPEIPREVMTEATAPKEQDNKDVFMAGFDDVTPPAEELDTKVEKNMFPSSPPKAVKKDDAQVTKDSGASASAPEQESGATASEVPAKKKGGWPKGKSRAKSKPKTSRTINFSSDISKLILQSEEIQDAVVKLGIKSTRDLAQYSAEQFMLRAEVMGVETFSSASSGGKQGNPYKLKLDVLTLITKAKAEIQKENEAAVVDPYISSVFFLPKPRAAGEIKDEKKWKPPSVSWHKFAKDIEPLPQVKFPKKKMARKHDLKHRTQAAKILELVRTEIGTYSTIIQEFIGIDAPVSMHELQSDQVSEIGNAYNAIKMNILESSPDTLPKRGAAFLRWMKWYKDKYPLRTKGYLSPKPAEVHEYLMALKMYAPNASKNAYDSLNWFKMTCGLKFPDKKRIPCGKVLTAQVQNWNKGEDQFEVPDGPLHLHRLAFTPRDILNFEIKAFKGCIKSAATLVMIWSSTRPIHIQRSVVESYDVRNKTMKILCFSGKRRGAWRPYKYRCSMISIARVEIPWWNTLINFKQSEENDFLFGTKSDEGMSVNQIGDWIVETVGEWEKDPKKLATKKGYSARLFIPGLCSACGISTSNALDAGLWRDGRFEPLAASSLPSLYDDARLLKGEMLRRKIAEALLKWDKVYKDSFKSWDIFAFMLFLVRNDKRPNLAFQQVTWGQQIDKRLWGLQEETETAETGDNIVSKFVQIPKGRTRSKYRKIYART